MFEPIKAAFGVFMGGFYATLIPTTKPMQLFVTRGLSQSVAWAPSRMVDAAEEMLAAWQRNDTKLAGTRPAELPVILVAMSKDYMPTGPDFTRQMAVEREIIIPQDPKERIFRIRTIAGDIRAQVAIFAQDEPTAKSIAAQFSLYVESGATRAFGAKHRFAGMDLEWPVHMEGLDVPAISVASESKNLTILAIDITLKASIPLFTHPLDTDLFKDGKGTDGNPNDPHGYMTLGELTTSSSDQNSPLNGSTLVRLTTILP